MAYQKDNDKEFIEYIRSTVDPTFQLSKSDAIKYAAKMGASDSLRGIAQFGAGLFGMEDATEELKRKDRTLQSILDNPEYGTEAMTAFLGSAVVADPVGYLPIVGAYKKAKNVWQLAKYGGMAGGFHAGMGYVSEESPGLVGEKQSRLENIAIGATAGTALGGLGGAALEGIAKIRGKEGYFKKADEIEMPKKTAEDELDELEQVIINEQPLTVGRKVIAPDRKNVGTIIQIDNEGFATLQFVSKEGATATKKFPLDELRPPKAGEAKKSPEGAVAEPSQSPKDVVFVVDRKSNSKTWLYKTKDQETKTLYTVQKALDEQGEVIEKQWEVTIQPTLRGRKRGESIADFNRRKKQAMQTRIFGSKEKATQFVRESINPPTVRKQKDIAEEVKPVEGRPIQEDVEKKIVEKKVQEVFSEQSDEGLSMKDSVVKFYQDKFGIALKNKMFDNWGSALTGSASGIAGYNSVDDPNATALEKFSMGFIAGLAGAGITKGLGKIKVGDDALAEHMGRFLIDDYGLSSDYKLLRRQLQVNKNSIGQQFLDVALEAKEKLDEPQRKLLYNLMTGNLDSIDDLAEEGIEINLKGRKLIQEMGQKYVDLGLLDNATFNNNINTYLHRSYVKHLKSPKGKKLFDSMRQVSLAGNELRPRGLVEEISESAFNKAGSKWKAQGWEVIGEPSAGKVKIRRDFTPDERKQMGEIEDASFAIAETGRLMANDIATAKFFRDLSNDSRYAITKKSWEAKGKPEDFIQVPNTTLRGTTVKSYGDLAERTIKKADGTIETLPSMYVHKDVMRDISRMVKMTNENVGMEDALKAFDKMQSIWKKSKTAWNPAVHANNVMSNFVLLDFADTSYSFLPKAIAELRKGNKSEFFRLAREQGVFDVDIVTKELRDTSGAMEQALAKITDADKPSQMLGYSTDMFNSARKVKQATLGNLENLYQLEDQVFRMAVFMDRINKKMDVTEAALDARKWFIDYDINAPAINFLRRTATPFLSYTYRIVPLLAETAALRPHKFAKWAMIGYGLNELGKQVGGGDPELERITMREELSKTLWGVPYMPPTVIRMPFNSSDGDSQYLDISRWIPGGDIFEEREKGVPGIPAPLQPSFGLYGDIYNVAVARTDPFTGQEVEGLGVGEDGKAIAKGLVKRLTPNVALVPGSYAYEKMRRSFRTQKGFEKGELIPGSKYATEYSPWEAFAYTMGIKLRPQDPTVNQKIKEIQLNKDLKEVEGLVYKARKDFEKGDISYKQREQAFKDAELKRIQIIAEWNAYMRLYNKALGKKVKRIEREQQAKGGIVEGEDNVPFTKEDPADRINPYTGEPYQEQMTRLGFDKGGKVSKRNENKINIYHYLKEKGLRPEAIIGIMANIDKETDGTYDYQMEQYNGKGYGLFQLDPGGDHVNQYNMFLERNNTKDSMESQLDYFLESIYDVKSPALKSNGGKNARDLRKLFSSGNVEDITKAITEKWERPDDYLKRQENPTAYEKNLTDRIERAKKLSSDTLEIDESFDFISAQDIRYLPTNVKRGLSNFKQTNGKIYLPKAEADDLKVEIAAEKMSEDALRNDPQGRGFHGGDPEYDPQVVTGDPAEIRGRQGLDEYGTRPTIYRATNPESPLFFDKYINNPKNLGQFDTDIPAIRGAYMVNTDELLLSSTKDKSMKKNTEPHEYMHRGLKNKNLTTDKEHEYIDEVFNNIEMENFNKQLERMTPEQRMAAKKYLESQRDKLNN